MSELIGKILRLVLTNNFHYNGKCIDENERSLTIIDQKNCRVQIARDSIMIQEVVL